VKVSTLHRHRIARGIHSRYDRDELRRRLSAVDLVACDIDECLFPGFSQTSLGHQIFYHIVTRPTAATDIRFVPQLLHGGAYIRKVKLLRRLGRTPSNATLMRRYEHSMWAIPREYFDNGVRTVVERSFDGVPRTLALLGRQARVGLVSFGIHLIAEEYVRQLNRMAGGPFVVFAEANPIDFQPGADGRPVFAGYNPPPRTEPRHKREALQRQLDRFGARCPLVFGNGRDEGAMSDLARERGGLSLGFCPTPRDEAAFDLVVHRRDWRPIAGLVQALLG